MLFLEMVAFYFLVVVGPIVLLWVLWRSTASIQSVVVRCGVVIVGALFWPLTVLVLLVIVAATQFARADSSMQSRQP